MSDMDHIRRLQGEATIQGAKMNTGGTGLSGAKMFPDGKYECLGCGDKPHQAGRCTALTLFTKRLCECTFGIGDTVWVARG